MTKPDRASKPNCYECKHRGTVPGSAHSSCHHPSLPPIPPELQLLGIFASVRRSPPIQVNTEKLAIKGNAHGIRNGWFNWPMNFDPVWLEECNGYEPKT